MCVLRRRAPPIDLWIRLVSVESKGFSTKSTMFAVQNLAKVAPRMANTAVQQVRNNHIVTKPRNRVSFVEKCLHGVFMAAVPLVLPMWWATHFTEWTAQFNEQ